MIVKQGLPERTDEVGILTIVPKTIGRATILRVGQFLPGTSSTYAAVVVLARWELAFGVDNYELSTHVAIFRDDPAAPRWAMEAGHYFDADYQAALRDLADRK